MSTLGRGRHRRSRQRCGQVGEQNSAWPLKGPPRVRSRQVTPTPRCSRPTPWRCPPGSGSRNRPPSTTRAPPAATPPRSRGESPPIERCAGPGQCQRTPAQPCGCGCGTPATRCTVDRWPPGSTLGVTTATPTATMKPSSKLPSTRPNNKTRRPRRPDSSTNTGTRPAGDASTLAGASSCGEEDVSRFVDAMTSLTTATTLGYRPFGCSQPLVSHLSVTCQARQTGTTGEGSECPASVMDDADV